MNTFRIADLNAVSSTQGVANVANGVSGHFNPRFDFNRYGGTLGGPIRKDKIFAFADYEAAGTRSNRCVNGDLRSLLRRVTQP